LRLLDDDDWMEMKIVLTEFAVIKNLKKWANSHEDHFPKTLFALSRCKIIENDGSGDLLSQLWMHINEWDEVALVAQQRRKWKTRCEGTSWLFIVAHFMAVTCIYREDLPRVTTSHIRHRLIEKNKRQKKATNLWGFGSDFNGPFTRTSCAHCPTPPGEASERVCVFLSLLSSTLLQVYKEQSTFK
jgi:hypothetical protein